MESHATETRPRTTITVLLVAFALAVAACGGSDTGSDAEAVDEPGPPWSVEEVVAAYDAAGGGEFEEFDFTVRPNIRTLSPQNFEVGSDELTTLNKSLGNSSVLFQVHVFTDDEVLADDEMIEQAFEFTAMELVDKDTYEGTNVRGVVVDNVVIQGPPTDNGTFEAFAKVIRDLA